MPKSKNRKGQKLKAKARTQKLQQERASMEKKFKQYFEAEMAEMKRKQESTEQGNVVSE